MSDSLSSVRETLVRPADASYGSPLQRWAVAGYVGIANGLLGAMAIYVFHHQPLAVEWATPQLMAGVVVLSGILIKLLCQQLRTSVVAFGIALLCGFAVSIAFAVAPYYILNIPTAMGWALLPVVRDAITFVIFGQFLLQITGYLLGVVFDGVRA